MSQHDLTIDNAAGSAVRADLNLALQALGSTSIGSSAPGTLQTGQIWIDNSATPWVLKVYDGAQHITVGTINATTNVFAYSGSGASLTAGTTPLTTLDIDGGTDIGADLTTSDLIVVDDGAGGTNRKAALSRINTLVQAAGGFPLTALDIDGATDIGEAIVDADLFVIDNGAGGTNRKVAASRLKTYAGGSAGITFGTAVSPTSVATVTFTGIPAGTNRVEIAYAGMTFAGSDAIYTQLGDSGGIETSGYLASVSSHSENVERTTDFRHHNNGMTSEGAAALIQYSRVNGNMWVMHSVSRGNLTNSAAGSKTLSGELTQIKVFTILGNNMTAGTIQISYET